MLFSDHIQQESTAVLGNFFGNGKAVVIANEHFQNYYIV